MFVHWTMLYSVHARSGGTKCTIVIPTSTFDGCIGCICEHRSTMQGKQDVDVNAERLVAVRAVALDQRATILKRNYTLVFDEKFRTNARQKKLNSEQTQA